MRSAILTRTSQSDDGTFGTIVTDSGFECCTGELPWRDNKPEESRIPPGTYICNWRQSPVHGFCYHVEDVPNRTGIEIHAANFMGDKSLGLKSELLGCIAPGMNVGVLENQVAVLNSREALTLLEEDLESQSFQLTIEDSNFLLIKS